MIDFYKHVRTYSMYTMHTNYVTMHFLNNKHELHRTRYASQHHHHRNSLHIMYYGNTASWDCEWTSSSSYANFKRWVCSFLYCRGKVRKRIDHHVLLLSKTSSGYQHFQPSSHFLPHYTFFFFCSFINLFVEGEKPRKKPSVWFWFWLFVFVCDVNWISK